MTHTEVNNIELPTLGSNELIKPDLFNEGIKTLDLVKVQYKTAEYVYDSETGIASIMLNGSPMTFGSIKQILDMTAYYFRIKKDDAYLDLLKRVDFDDSTSPVTNGVFTFGGLSTLDGGSVKVHLLTITSNDGADNTVVAYSSGDVLATSGKVTSLSAASTHDQYPSAKAAFDFITSSVNANAAYYITKDAAGNPFATKAELDAATTFYSGGVVRVPTRNDYCIVEADEEHDDYSCRYLYQGDQWEFQYSFDKQFTAVQLAAVNSGITAEKVTSYDNIISQGLNPKAMVFNADKTLASFEEKTDILPVSNIVLLTYFKNNFIAFYSKGTALSRTYYNIKSTDGKTWSTATALGFSSRLKIINNKLFGFKPGSGGLNGNIYYTDNAIDALTDFKSIGQTPANDNITPVCYSSIYEKYYYLCYTEGSPSTGSTKVGIKSSSDLATWELISDVYETDSLKCIACGNGLFVISGKSNDGTDIFTITSEDGTTWTKHSGMEQVFLDLVYFKSNFFGFNSTGVYKSNNGTEWTKVLDGNISDITAYDDYILATSDTFVAVSKTGDLWRQVITDMTNKTTAVYDNKSTVLSLSKNSTSVFIASFSDSITQEGVDITDKVIALLKEGDTSTPVIGVMGTDYGEASDTFTGVKYIWCGDTDPGEAVRAQYKNTMFFVTAAS